MPSRDDVREYYDRNTRLFLRFGSSSELQTIHRALWMDGVDSLPQALDASNELILAQARALPGPLLVADLGCGVGASLMALLGRLPPGSRGFGLTLSPLQARLGGRAFASRGLPGLVCEADFQALPLAAGFDLAYAIESFVHAPDAGRFLAGCAHLLRPGGRLVIVDDFLGEGVTSSWRDLYRRGWQVNSLLSSAAVQRLADRHGLHLREDRFLTPFLRLRALPDPLARPLAGLFGPLWRLHPIVPSMLGSMALQKCLKDGSVEYRCLVLERV